jgi:hypothetical protein
LPNVLPIDPAEIEHLLAATSTAAGAAGATGRRARRWRDWRGKRSAQHKQARALYLEVLGNLLLCRIGRGTHPPELIVASREWRRPGTLALLAELLDPRQLSQVAAAYTLLDAYETLFRLPWTELLPVRLWATDVVVIGQVAERFAEAELVLRRTLLDSKGQAAMEKTLAENMARITEPSSSRTARLRNALGSVPIGTKLIVLLSVLAGWRLARRPVVVLPRA